MVVDVVVGAGATVVATAAAEPRFSAVVDGEAVSAEPDGATTGVVALGADVVCDDATVVVVAWGTAVDVVGEGAATVVVVAGATVVVVAGASTIESVRLVESASLRRWLGADALRVHVPVDTAVSAPVDAFTVHTEVVDDEYVTPWPAGSVDAVVTGKVVTPVRCNGVEPYDHVVGVFIDCDAWRS